MSATDGWGPVLLDGGARFRLWAPAARRVCVVGARGRVPMVETGGGWWRVETDLVEPGGAYRFGIDDEILVPDPAARAQVGDVHGPSRLIDPAALRIDDGWRGRPWEEAVVYELHVGTFTPEGTLDAAIARLPHLRDLGVTAVELMPIAQFSGDRGWGYDGVLLYAPHRAYGGPEALARFVAAAHALGLMVILDVVYNHFGPDGNYLPRYAPQFFDPDRHTPWGAAIDYAVEAVRAFATGNAAFWIADCGIDGLRLDAVDRIVEPEGRPILPEIARAARAAAPDRPVHLMTEDDRNIVRLHAREADGRPRLYSAEWNDDFHHVAHVAATGEARHYYADYLDGHGDRFARMLASGFDYQGRPSPYRRGEPRGEPSGGLPPTAFVNFLQNHDQIGNRPLGDRLTTLASPRALAALTAVLLLAPQIPLLFMGEEWAETRPFLFFVDFEGALAEAVRRGRRAEFADWHDAHAARTGAPLVPDPVARETFAASKLDWSKREGPEGAERLALVRRLLALRASEIAPRLGGMTDGAAEGGALGAGAFGVRWRLGDGSRLTLAANLSDAPASLPVPPARARLLHETHPRLSERLKAEPAPAWSALWTIAEDGR